MKALHIQLRLVWWADDVMTLAHNVGTAAASHFSSSYRTTRHLKLANTQSNFRAERSPKLGLFTLLETRDSSKMSYEVASNYAPIFVVGLKPPYPNTPSTVISLFLHLQPRYQSGWVRDGVMNARGRWKYK